MKGRLVGFREGLKGCKEGDWVGTVSGVSEWVQERRRKEGMGTRKV